MLSETLGTVGNSVPEKNYRLIWLIPRWLGS